MEEIGVASTQFTNQQTAKVTIEVFETSRNPRVISDGRTLCPRYSKVTQNRCLLDVVADQATAKIKF